MCLSMEIDPILFVQQCFNMKPNTAFLIRTEGELISAYNGLKDQWNPKWPLETEVGWYKALDEAWVVCDDQGVVGLLSHRFDAEIIENPYRIKPMCLGDRNDIEQEAIKFFAEKYPELDLSEDEDKELITWWDMIEFTHHVLYHSQNVRGDLT